MEELFMYKTKLLERIEKMDVQDVFIEFAQCAECFLWEECIENDLDCKGTTDKWLLKEGLKNAK